MKSTEKAKNLQPTKAKTRKGVIKWLKSLNPFMDAKALDASDTIVAVHVNRFTGAIVAYEYANGALSLSILAIAA